MKVLKNALPYRCTPPVAATAETTKVYFAITAKQRILIMQIAAVRRAEGVAAV